MKNSLKLISLLIIMALFSCSKEPIIESEISEQSVESKSSAKKSTIPIVDLDGNEIEGASSTLHRKKNKIMVNFKTENLIPGNVYTLWFVIFGDMGGPPILVTYADGLIANPSGKGNFSTHLSVGDIFNNPLTAEVHMALRTHGPVQQGMMPEQIETIDGGCTSGFPSGPMLHPDSDVVGYCANIQVAMHPAN
ncbi:MAG: hypothetical protein V7719_12105 [Psychroserpens sp.]|uniref:hypothetical protein n=1 Tax=Psychroserpens sp. TaxID=2020870 RepID=UPI00300373C3